MFYIIPWRQYLPFSGCVLDEYEGGCYLIGRSHLNYMDGLAYCLSLGANLLTVYSQEENDRAYQYIGTFERTHLPLSLLNQLYILYVDICTRFGSVDEPVSSCKEVHF